MKYIRLYEEKLRDFEIMTMDSEPLIEALKNEIEKEDYDLDYIRDLVTYGHFDVDALWKNNWNQERTFLMATSISNKVEIIPILLEAGADPNIQTKWGGETALSLASWQNHSQVVQELLKHPKTDPNVKGYDGSTALMKASELNHLQVVRELLQHPKINPNIHDSYNCTALMKASEWGRSQVVREILQHPQIDPNIKNRDRVNTALHLASRLNYPQVVEALLKHPKTDITITNERGETAWDLAKPNIREQFPELNPERSEI